MTKLQIPDADLEKARIVRALFDVTTLLSLDPDRDSAAGALARLARLRTDARGLDDPGFAAAVDRALQLLLPDGPGGTWS